jgi:hypothetical protein
MPSEPFWLGRWAGRGRPDITVTQPPAEFGGERWLTAEGRQALMRAEALCSSVQGQAVGFSRR